MKTKTQLSALVLIITMMFASSTFANNKSFDFEEESYIDDIPFNTEWVVSELMTLSYDFEEQRDREGAPVYFVAYAGQREIHAGRYSDEQRRPRRR